MPSYRNRSSDSLATAGRAARPLVRSAHERMSRELKKNARARYGGATVWTKAKMTSEASDSCKITKTDFYAFTRIWGRAEGRPVKRMVSETIETTTTTSERKNKRRASSAADDDRVASKIKTQHVTGILKVSGRAKSPKQVRWCTSVQEPREIVRPQMRVACPDQTPTPTPSAELAEPRSRRLKNLANFPKSTSWINQLAVPTWKSLEFEDLPDVRPMEVTPRKAMVMRYSDDHQWNRRRIVIRSWKDRSVMYNDMLKMQRVLERFVAMMARRGAPMAQLLASQRA
ncbi:hypothetical protein L226DRAFT_613727 [Lentinus tigrinus ALCF2SS1-7]|uniref:Uncharacterized protein n=1 Tax=Lentinus tigrinus ALCF2SS1-6 TaxID=1328759 RepID=A0A5C2RYP1_9APHY|nr:hypothetical protein L227DRAFT_603206 [Lentinus tigrinus ALCF2SS1-6]RPD73934.1 hypothetical protein L226DRAFT_613727 [Lentinus tigrinus ALCF2SS1-7]